MPSSSHTASSAAVELSASVWLGVPLPVAGLKVVALPVLAPSRLRLSPFRSPPVGAVALACGEYITFGVNSDGMASPSLLVFPASTVQMIDHLFQGVLASFVKTLGDVLRVIGIRAIVGGWSNSAEGYPSGRDVI